MEYGLCVCLAQWHAERIRATATDLFVDMPPKAMKMVALKHYLQDILGRSVDLIRSRSTLDPFLLKQIEKDGITIFA